ncbi:unnamed protein product [Ilex paraguariensis]|uniref:Bidirectional sugar transporter SWEET n=1 Tax=Ilex paraguariensis TaxID=185542 RepID=A0ABC8SVW5_9AQUA
MTSAETSRFIVGVVGDIISFFLFASPSPTIFRIYKNKSSEGFLPDPYCATVLNCLLWIFYGLPFVTPDQALVVVINSIGLALELIYLTVFFIYTDSKRRCRIIICLTTEVVFFAAIVLATLLGFHIHHRRNMFVGLFCVIFGIIMYASPLTKMWDVIRTKSVEYMPFWLSVASFCNGAIWLTYALIKFDLYIMIGNGVGALFGLSQLILYACYYKSTPKKDDEKPSEVQLQNAPVRVAA